MAPAVHFRTSVSAKRCVYLIRNERDGASYVGITSDVAKRMAAHNAGESPHTAKYRPWRLVVTVEFSCEEKALAFERYLKSGSGRAFVKRHF